MPYLTGTYANPHSDDHAAGWNASAAVERARADVAAAIGADPIEVVFTSGATEANNLALLGVAGARSAPGRIVVSAIEHKAVLGPARALRRAGHDVVVLPVDAAGYVALELLDAALDASTALVSIGAVNNEIGTVQPMAEIAALCRSRGTLVHSDATQALAWGFASVGDWGVDFASLSAHKAGGPKGVGAFYASVDARDRISPVQHGGDQEGGLRPGTLPTPLCVGFGAACKVLPDGGQVASWRDVTRRLLDGLRDLWPGLRLNGPHGLRHPGNLSVTLPGVEADRLLALVQPDLAMSRGSACTSGTPEPSHVLIAIGVSPSDVDRTLRLSTGVVTTPRDVDEALEVLRRVRRRL